MKKKLLIYSDCYIYGGSERLMSFLVKNAIINKQFDVTFAYRNHKKYTEGMTNDFQYFKGEVIPLKLLSNDTVLYNLAKGFSNSFLVLFIKVLLKMFYYSGLYFLYNSIHFTRLILRVRPDVLHINNGGYPAARTCSQLAIIAKILRVNKIVYQVNNQARAPKVFGHIINPIVNSCVDSFITASLLAKANLIEKVGFSFAKIQLVKNVVILKPCLLNRKEILKNYTLDTDTIILVQVAFLTKRKGQIKSIEALNTLIKADNKQKYALFLIGDGEDLEILKKAVYNFQLTEYVFFLGNRSNYHEFLAIADFVLMPSIQDEDMPLVIIESILLGKCIISSDFAGIGEVLKNNYSGILLNPNSDNLGEGIANAILELRADKRKIDQLIQNVANESIQFSEDNYGKQLCEIYNT